MTCAKSWPISSRVFVAGSTTSRSAALGGALLVALDIVLEEWRDEKTEQHQPQEGNQTMATNSETAEVRIVVLQRGWVVVGYYREDGDEVTVTDASVIRVWGTTKGLGELVEGPTRSTVLDRAGTVRAHRGAVVLTVDADAAKWADEL